MQHLAPWVKHTLRYVLSVLTVSTTVWLITQIPLLKQESTLVLALAIAVSTQFLGTGPGLIAVGLALLEENYFILLPTHGFNYDATLIPKAIVTFSLWLLVSRLVAQQKKYHTLLLEQSLRDPLTGLANRRLLINDLSIAIANSRRSGNSFAIILIDLNHFKEINDRLGHVSGDTLLQDVAARLTNMVRESDRVCRWGGDEFVMLLSPGKESVGVEIVVDKLSQALSEPLVLQGETVIPTAGIGVAYYPHDAESGDTLIRIADERMYTHKHLVKARSTQTLSPLSGLSNSTKGNNHREYGYNEK